MLGGIQLSKKYLFCDLDGTLLQFAEVYLQPNKQDIQSVREFVKQGHVFVIATGRGIVDIRKVTDTLDLDHGYAIAQNGAYVYQETEIVLSKSLAYQDLLEILNFLKEEQLCVEYVMVSMQSGKRYMKAFTFRGWLAKILFKRRARSYNFSAMQPLTWKDPEAIAKLFFYIRSNKMYEVEQRLKKKFADIFEVFETSPKSLEVCAKNVSKGEAVRYIMEKERLEKEQVGFVGDSGNDISALNIVGHPYIMKNARDKFQMNEAIVVDSVAEAIHDFMKKGGK